MNEEYSDIHETNFLRTNEPRMYSLIPRTHPILQIHVLEDGKVQIYSRNQENNTSKYPDITSRMRNALTDSVKSAVIDSEAVAWDRTQKQILPFQVLSTRKRKVCLPQVGFVTFLLYNDTSSSKSKICRVKTNIK